MLAEILKCVRAGKVTRGLRDQNLATVARRRDSSGSMDIEPNVALFGHDRLPRMDTHANADRAGCQPFTTGRRGGKCVGCLGKRDEERITLRVHLNTSMADECLTQRAPVLGERLGIAIAQLVEQPRRPLDVREEEGHGPGGQLGHTMMMRRLEPKV